MKKLALTTATFAVGKALNNVAINVVGCVMACFLVVAWVTVFSVMIRAIILKDILWPQKQEDREEGGWKTNVGEKQACDIRRCNTEEEALARTSSMQRRPSDTGHTNEVSKEHTEYHNPASSGTDGEPNHLPPIPERLIEEPIRGRIQKQNDDMV